MHELLPTSQFRRDVKLAQKRGKDTGLIRTVIENLAQGQTLSPKHKDHPLSGNYAGFRECHITPDWLLIYKIEKEILVLSLTRTGTHSELF